MSTVRQHPSPKELKVLWILLGMTCLSISHLYLPQVQDRWGNWDISPLLPSQRVLFSEARFRAPQEVAAFADLAQGPLMGQYCHRLDFLAPFCHCMKTLRIPVVWHNLGVGLSQSPSESSKVTHRVWKSVTELRTELVFWQVALCSHLIKLVPLKITQEHWRCAMCQLQLF